jgi:hypothetical protein
MGPSLIQSGHTRAVDAERRRVPVGGARSGPRLDALPTVVAVALVAFAFAVLASTASARPIDAPGTPHPFTQQVASSRQTVPAPAPASDGSSAATLIGILAGTVLVLGGGVALLDTAGRRARVR